MSIVTDRIVFKLCAICFIPLVILGFYIFFNPDISSATQLTKITGELTEYKYVRGARNYMYLRLKNEGSKRFSTSSEYDRAFDRRSFKEEAAIGDVVTITVIKESYEQKDDWIRVYSIEKKGKIYLPFEKALERLENYRRGWLVLAIVMLLVIVPLLLYKKRSKEPVSKEAILRSPMVRLK